MQLHSILFEVPRRRGFYRRLANVLEYTAAINSPSTPITIHEIDEPDVDVERLGIRRKAIYIDNTRKTKHHNRIVQEAHCGDILCLLDADMMVLGDLSEVGKLNFDIAYTVRPESSQYEFNSGAIFVRISEQAKAFYQAWYKKTLEFLSDEHQHNQYKPRYGGINQCGLAWMLKNSPMGLNFNTLPCWKWNCENETWADFCEETKIVHILGNLRRHIKGSARSTDPTILRLAAIWSEHERANEMARSA